MQATARPVKPHALGQIGALAFNPDEHGYAKQCGEFSHPVRTSTPRATIPFLIEAWVQVDDHKGDEI
jgi:hypothetical protein